MTPRDILHTLPPFVRLERVTRVAALGVRFYDPIGEQFVSDLQVTAWWLGPGGRETRRRPRPMFPGPSGVFVLHAGASDWAGLEAGAVGNSSWEQLPAARDALIAVVDPAGRYLPFTFTAPVPPQQREPAAAAPGGLFVPDCLLVSPAAMSWPLDALPLFPAPASPVPGGVAAVRAGLWDLAANRPAAGAVLEVIYDGLVVGRGIADDRGSVLAVTPYPAPVDFTPDSPGTGESAWLQRWSLEPSVAWTGSASLWAPLPGASLYGVPPCGMAFLDLCAAFGQLGQPRATPWASRSPDQPLASASLRLDEDLILSTVVGGAPASQLLVTL